MIRRSSFAVAVCLLAACAHRPPSTTPAAAPSAIADARGATPGQLDSLWVEVDSAYHRGKWEDVIRLVQRFALEAPAGDARTIRGRLYLGEAFMAKKEYLQAAREFRRVSDENPIDSLAPEGLLRVGDAYARLWRRPELDATYGQSALATYQELQSRYPDSEAAKAGLVRTATLQDNFALKAYKAALYYMRLKAYESAILYIKDLVVSYPRAKIVPEALVKLVSAYRALNYQEDLQETCEYLRKYHAADATALRTCAGVAPPAAPPS